MRRDVVVVAVFLAILPGSFLVAMDDRGAAAAFQVQDGIFEVRGVEQGAAERIFADAEAAIYFADQGRVRWMTRQVSPAATLEAAAGFHGSVEGDYPAFRAGAHGAWIMKTPAAMPPAGRSEAAKERSDAVAFTETFENGLSNWDLDDNTLELYAWGTTTCGYRSGSRSADALRGGVNTLGCSDAYAPEVVTLMTHKSCEAVAGASQAWLDVWIHVASESGKDKLGFYYDDASGEGYGYTFSGSWPAWFHVVLNMKQWYAVGDVTATSCPRITVAFQSDAQTQSGFGARIDDLAVTTGAPSFLGCSISASPLTGVAPLTVSFTSAVTSTSGTSYLWSFGDAAQSTATAASASFTYNTPGQYQVRLRASQSGVYSYAYATIHVTSAATHSSKRRGVRQVGGAALASKTIGPAGGTLAGGGVTVDVPAGAFSTDAALVLVKSRGAITSAGEVSDRFTLRGLPAAIAKDLVLQIPLAAGAPALAAGEAYYVSIDAPSLTKSRQAGDAVAMKPFRQAATKSGTTLTARITPDFGTFVPATASRIVPEDAHAPYATDIQAEKFVAVETAHFRASVRSSREDSTRQILDAFEADFDRLESLGFSFDCRIASGTFRKIEIVPWDFGVGGDLGGHVSKSSPCGSGWFFNDYIEITTSYGAQSNEVRWTAGHELFHMLQDIYSPGGAQANLWLKEASSIWYEVVMGNSCPSVQSSNQAFPWKGLFNASYSASSDSFWSTDRQMRHGYGASYFLLHHTRSITDQFVRVVWDLVHAGNSEFAALQTAMGSTSLADDWTDFAKEYFYGNATLGCAVSWATFGLEDLAEASALPKTFSIDAYPYAAVSRNVDLRKFKSDDEVPVTIRAAGLEANQRVYVYDVRAKAEIATLTESDPVHEIEDLGELSGTILVLLFVDTTPPAGEGGTPANKVDITVGGEQYRCWAKWYVQTYKEPSSTGGYVVCTGNCVIYDGSIYDYFVGALQNDHFRAETMWCPDPPMWCRWRDDSTTYDNLLEFDVDQKAAQVQNVNLDMKRTSIYGSSTEWYKVGLPLPRLSSGPAGFQYKLTGGSVCGAVTTGKALFDVVCDSSSYFLLSCEPWTETPAPE